MDRLKTLSPASLRHVRSQVLLALLSACYAMVKLFSSTNMTFMTSKQGYRRISISFGHIVFLSKSLIAVSMGIFVEMVNKHYMKYSRS